MSTTTEDGVEVMAVAGTTSPLGLGGAIAKVLRTGLPIELHAVGAASVNQAVKAIATARIHLSGDGIDLWFVPGFLSGVNIDGQERTVIRFRVCVDARGAQ